MEGISYTGRVFSEVAGEDPRGSIGDAIDADPTIENEIVFILETGSEFTDTGIRGHLYVKGVGTEREDKPFFIEGDVHVKELGSGRLRVTGYAWVESGGAVFRVTAWIDRKGVT